MQQKELNKKKKGAGFFIALAIILSLLEEIIGEAFGALAGFFVIACALGFLAIYKLKNKNVGNNTSSYTYDYDDLKRDDLVEDYNVRTRNRCPNCGYRILPNDEKCDFCNKKVKYRG